MRLLPETYCANALEKRDFEHQGPGLNRGFRGQARALLHTRLLPGLLLLALTAGCALTEPIVRPDLDLPAQWAEAGGAPAATAPVHDTWWRDFGSAPLDALVAEALAAAPDLRIQAERVVQATLDFRVLNSVRSRLPALQHRVL